MLSNWILESCWVIMKYLTHCETHPVRLESYYDPNMQRSHFVGCFPIEKKCKWKQSILPKMSIIDLEFCPKPSTLMLIFSPFSPPVVIRFFPLLYSLPPVIFGRLGIQIDHCSFSENLFTLGWLICALYTQIIQKLSRQTHAQSKQFANLNFLWP